MSEKKAENRLKEFVIGNKENYVKTIRLFLKKIKFPEKINYTESKKFCEEMTKELREIEKRTGKNYYAMKNLIGAELDDIVKELRIIDNVIKDLKKRLGDEKETVEKLRIIRNYIKDLGEQPTKIDIANKYKNSLNELEKKKDEKESEYKKLKNSQEYSELEKNRLVLDVVRKEKHEKVNELVNTFSPLQKALKKYDRGESKLVNLYLENPIIALLSDARLEILNILNRLEQNLGKLDLDSQKAEKTKYGLKFLNKEYLFKIKDEYTELTNREERLAKKIENSNILEKLSKLKDEKDNCEKRLKSVKSELTQINEKLVDKEEVFSEIVKLAEEITGKEVLIDGTVGE